MELLDVVRYMFIIAGLIYLIYAIAVDLVHIKRLNHDKHPEIKIDRRKVIPATYKD